MCHHGFIFLELYGQNWEGHRFNPNFRNIRTSDLMKSAHHCNVCKKPRSRSCFTELHIAFCCALVERNGQIVRCNEQITVLSDGCAVHSTGAARFNTVFKEAFQGQHRDNSWFDKFDKDREIIGKEEEERKKVQEEKLRKLLEEDKQICFNSSRRKNPTRYNTSRPARKIATMTVGEGSNGRKRYARIDEIPAISETSGVTSIPRGHKTSVVPSSSETKLTLEGVQPQINI
jgi:hypothetical protein